MHSINCWLYENTKRVGRRVRGSTDVLRARVIWSAMLEAAGSEEELIKICGGSIWGEEGLELRASEINAYRSGDRTPSRARLARFAAAFPEVQSTLEWPIELLQARELSKRRLDSIFRSSFCGYDRRWDNLYGWYGRQDAIGFLALVLAYRRYSLLRDTDSQWLAATLMFRAVPALCRSPAVRPHTALVHLQVVLLRDLYLPLCCKHIEPDWVEWGRQIIDPNRPLPGIPLDLNEGRVYWFDGCENDSIIVSDGLAIDLPKVDWAVFGIQNNPWGLQPPSPGSTPEPATSRNKESPRNDAEPGTRKRPQYTMTELLAESDYGQTQSREDREWVDAPAAGRELL